LSSLYSGPPDQSLWIAPVLKGVTCNKVVACLRKLGVNVSTYVEDLDKDVSANDRDPNKTGSYAVAFRRTVEADDDNKSKSANDLVEAGHKGITLLERLLLELGYFLAIGQHLDVQNITLCTGSRDSGVVPSVGWGGGLRVSWCNPGDAYGFLRSRSVVS